MLGLATVAPKLTAQDSMTINVSVSFADFSFDTVNGYDFIRSHDNRMAYLYDVGKPQLPVFVPTYIIPYWKTVAYAEVMSVDSEQIPGHWNIYPAQDPEDSSWTPPDTSVYYSDSLYPGIQTGRTVMASFDGAVLARPCLHIFQYRPLSGRLFLYTGITLKLVFKDAEPPINARQRYAHVQEIYDNMLKDLVENDKDISGWYRRPARINANGKASLPPAFAIITTSDQTPEAQQYADWTDRRGYPTQVVDVATILSTQPGRNPAEKVFNWIQAQYQAGLSFVLFLGHETEVPYRYLHYGDLPQKPAPPYPEAFQPSDIYFSSVSFVSTPECQGKPGWDCDEDQVYGESGSPSQDPPTGDAGSWDYYPEVFVGRVLSRKNPFVNEAQNWLTKVLKYEKNPGQTGDLTTVNFVAGTDPCVECEDTKEHYSDDFSFNDIYNQSANTVISDLNNTPCGWVNVYTHGEPTAFATKGTFIDSVLSAPFGSSDPNLSQLTNTDKYYLVYSYACLQATFDPYDSLSWNDPDHPLSDTIVAEAWTEAYGYRGGTAFIGNTRVNFGGVEHPYQEVFDSFLDYLFNPFAPNNRYLIGVALAHARTDNDISDYHARVTNLFGSPLTDMWDIATPIVLETDHPSAVPPETPVEFEVFVYEPTVPFPTPVPEAMVSLKSGTGSVYQFKRTGSNGRASFTVTASPLDRWIKVTATKHNYKPMESLCMVGAEGPLRANEMDPLPKALFLRLKSSNPVRGPVKVEFGIPPGDQGHVSLSVYDVSGRKIAELLEGHLPAGYFEARWEPGSDPSGVYLLVLETKKRTLTKKVINRR